MLQQRVSAAILDVKHTPMNGSVPGIAFYVLLAF